MVVRYQRSGHKLNYRVYSHIGVRNGNQQGDKEDSGLHLDEVEQPKGEEVIDLIKWRVLL